MASDGTGAVGAPVASTPRITGPHCCGQGFGEAEQPGVTDLEVRRTGLGACRHSDLQRARRTAVERLSQRVGDALGHFLVEHSLAAFAGQVEFLAVAVLDLDDRLRSAEFALVREGRERRGHGDRGGLRRTEDRRR